MYAAFFGYFHNEQWLVNLAGSSTSDRNIPPNIFIGKIIGNFQLIIEHCRLVFTKPVLNVWVTTKQTVMDWKREMI